MIGILLPLFAAGFCVVGFGPPALVGPGPGNSGVITAATFGTAAVPPVPPVLANGGIVVDGETGQVLWGKSAHQSFAPASMTKMMTALVALRLGRLDQVVPITVDAATLAGDSVMGLRPGERLTLRDLLYGLLVPSGDDAAIAIAATLGGERSFVEKMNLEAARLGLTDTHFANVHGLDAAGHVSSSYDMVAIAREAMADSTFRQIVATQHIVIRGHWTYDLHNTNYFLGRRPGVVGVKTGTTDQALHAITIADDRGDGTLYLTVMHTPNYVPDATSLLDYFEQTYTRVPLVLPETPLTTPPNGANPRHLTVASGFAPLLPRWRADTVTPEISLAPDSSLRATDNPDLPPPNAGTATFYSGGEPIARLPLELQ
jgi:D-alanyl-D-alanine carboxypeptidase